jgi:hypothetical protein
MISKSPSNCRAAAISACLMGPTTVFVRDLRGPAYVELEAAVTARVKHMDQ